MTKPPRVLAVQPNVEWYGSDRSFVLLVRTLVAAGWDITPVVPGHGEVTERLRASGVESVIADAGVGRPKIWGRGRTAFWLFVGLPIAALRMARLARTVDLVHCNTSTAVGAMLGARLARRPLVVHIRERPEPTRTWRLWAWIIGRLADEVIAVSRSVAEGAAALGLRTTVIHNGLEFPAMGPPRDSLRVVSVGRINQWKGHEVLVDAAALLRAREVDIDIRIAGDAFPGDEPRVDDLRDQIERLGLTDRVELLGYVDDVPALLATAGIFVSATTRPEPFGLALVDAMAAGLAAVASDHGGPAEIIVDGHTGVLVPPRDPRALAEALEQLLRDPATVRRLGAAAAHDVRARFGIRRTAAAVAVVWRRAAGAHS